MSNQQLLESYQQALLKENLFQNKKSLMYFMENLFHGIELEGKKVLDVGGGTGFLTFFMAIMGARKAICLEPEGHGSSEGVKQKFNKFKKDLNIQNAFFEPSALQDFKNNGEKFDVILLFHSVNHLNEQACINLLKDEKSKTIYKEIFDKLFSLAEPFAKLIICDTSNHNFFQFIKIKNPISPSIEWEKHQEPRVWQKLLAESGFSAAKISWSSFSQLGLIGKILFANKIMAWFFRSHFCLKMEKGAIQKPD